MPGAVGGHVGEPEARGDERGVGLDVGAHHEDVARLEGRVVLEQPDQHLPEHVDLACGPVARVHLDGPVVVGEDPAGPVRALSIQEVAPGVPVDGPAPELEDEMRELHRRLVERRGQVT